METFLSLVATDLYKKSNGDLSHTAIVFPNRRASIFFNQNLAQLSEKPLWAPTYFSISDLFQQLSTLKLGDSLQLVCELYKVFKQETGSQETLDDFYFWGELLIGDLDDLDKNLVDDKQLFSNLMDLKKLMDGHDYLTTEQIEAIKQFFQNFSLEKKTELKERFISLWDKLGAIYQHYKQNLSKRGIAYEGMVYRDAIEKLDVNKLTYERYVFVGFNVLNKVEIELFKKLKQAGKALFYWDYDIFYTDIPQLQNPPFTHEAGEFILRNLEIFPNELPKEMFDSLRGFKQIKFIASSTENAQAKYLPTWIDELTKSSYKNELDAKINQETAVVLCNESLLSSVLHTIPTNVDNINITMGFPLTQTPIYSFINAMMELHINHYRPSSGRYTYNGVIALLRHPYTRQVTGNAELLEKELTTNNRFFPLPSELKRDEFLELIFTHQDGNLNLCHQLVNTIKYIATLYRKPTTSDDENTTLKEDSIFDQLYRESLFKSYTFISRIITLIENGELTEIKTATLKRLINRLLTSSNIPFHGEPAIGMQIMGVLETRNLDFRNLLMLSLNEGLLPKNSSDASFIPYNLRKAFGMTTIEHKNAVYAYYFYRLIQRAENITLIYNTTTEGLNKGEMSRFMLQLLADYPHEIQHYQLKANLLPQLQKDIVIEKNATIINQMKENYHTDLNTKAFLSPSAINTYLDCPLKFYYQYVERIKAPDEVNAEIDSALFGTIFHRTAEMIYNKLTERGKEILKEDIEKLLKDRRIIDSYVDEAFKEVFFHVKPDAKAEYNGTQLINAKVIASYICQLLRNDLQYAPFSMEAMEKHVEELLSIDTSIGKMKIKIGGTIDRMDSKGDVLRIVDYKTGGYPKTPENITQLFTPAEERPNYILQTFIYAAIMCKKQGLKVAPSLLYIHQASNENYSPIITMGAARQAKVAVSNFSLYEDEFREQLSTLLCEIFDKEKPFTQTTYTKRCTYCDFKRLCRR